MTQPIDTNDAPAPAVPALEPSLARHARPPLLPITYRCAQAFLALLILFGGLAAWRIYGLWSENGVTIAGLIDIGPTVRMRELPEFLMFCAPLWMPVAALVACVWIYLLNSPRRWAIWPTLALALAALLLVFHVDGELHRLEGGYYEKSRWVEIFWQMARPIQSVATAWLLALPGLWAYSRWRTPRPPQPM